MTRIYTADLEGKPGWYVLIGEKPQVDVFAKFRDWISAENLAIALSRETHDEVMRLYDLVCRFRRHAECYNGSDSR